MDRGLIGTMKKLILSAVIVLSLFVTIIIKQMCTVPQASTENTLDGVDNQTDVEALLQLFPGLQAPTSCVYRVAPINPSFVGPTAVYTAGYIFFTDDGLNTIMRNYEWDTALFLPQFYLDEVECDEASISEQFTSVYQPRESTIVFMVLVDYNCIYFEGVID